MVVALINVDAYPFLAVSELTCYFEDTRKVVSGDTVLHDSKENKFLHQQVKILG